MPLTSDAALRSLLERTRSIAVLGIKSGDGDEAFRVPRYLQACGFRIRPVNPKLEEVLGECCVRHVGELGAAVDLLNVFRDARHLPGHVDEILALPQPPHAVWLQEGIRDDVAAQRLELAGIEVVQDRCIMVEHRRLLGSR